MRPILITAASAVISTLVAGVASADTIRFWTTENQPERLAKQQAMADDFNKKTGHTVEVIRLRKGPWHPRNSSFCRWRSS